MNLKILIDMNLSPGWEGYFESKGFESVHWSKIGRHDEQDSVILNYARENEYILFTNGLDFGALLAANKNISPSVIQVRTQDVLPLAIGELVINSLKQYENLLENGALISIDESKERARILPLKN